MTATAMAREIAEQPEAVRRTLAAHLSRTDEIAASPPAAGSCSSPAPRGLRKVTQTEFVH